MRSRLSKPILVAALVVVVGACQTQEAAGVDAGATDDVAVFVCTITAPTVCPDPPPHYADVAPIFQSACVMCHNGVPAGPWPLLQYSHVADWQDVIRANLLDCSMPPPDAGVPMTNEERTAILTWILCGFPM